MGNIKTQKKIFSVSELTRKIKGVVESAFPAVWVEGEVANFTHHSSGHMYFSLRDKNATLQCAMFRRANAKLKFRIKDGMKVICSGTISVYEPRGNYQLIIEEMEPKGIGALQLQFEELKTKLREERLFDPKHKVQIPVLPTKIGIVTSPTGAAIRDILNILKRRFANVEIIINPVKVQGQGAREQIRDAINDFNRLQNIDVMIVTRGGGSLEDLWAFNEEMVARAIFASKIPVISAVGHEIDFTISDFTADLRVPTPSAAAELVIPRKDDLIKTVDNYITRLKNALSGRVRQYEQMLDDLLKDITVHMGHLLKTKEQSFNLFIQKLEALSPLAILNRGYSITTKLPEGVIIKDVKLLKIGDRVETKLGKGKFKSKVDEIE